MTALTVSASLVGLALLVTVGGAAAGRGVRRYGGWVNLFAGWVVGVVGAVVGVVVAVVLLGHEPRSSMDLLLIGIPAMSAGELATVSLAVASARGVAFTRPSLRWLRMAAPALGCVVVSWYVWGALAERVGIPLVEQPIVTLIRAAPVISTMGVLRVWGAIGAPILEEAIFRGWLQGILSEKLGSSIGTALVIVAFTGMHADTPSALPPILVLAVVAGVLRAQSGSIVPGLLVHVGNNTLSLVLA